MVKKKFKITENGFRWIAFFSLFIVLAIINPKVFSLLNIFSIINNSAFTGLLAMALLMVMITGNFDLSLVAIGLTSSLGTILIFQALNIEEGGTVLMFIIAGIIGLICGLMNGFFVYKFNLPGIIVSLGMSQLYSGVLIVLSGVSYVQTLPAGMRKLSRWFITSIDTPDGTASISFNALLFAICVVMVWLILNKTMTGRGIYALGGDKIAATRVGFNIPWLYSSAYGVAGFLSGMAGMMFYANNALFQSDFILTEQQDAIAAVIFGGVILKDGKGSVGGALVGVLMITLINNCLYLVGVPSYAQQVIIGAIILVSVALSSLKQLRDAKK